jgi:acetoacetate decarboxylase
MPFPPAPWTLRGFALQTAQLVSCDRLQAFLPPTLEPIEVLPGYTVGGIYLSSYGTGSALEYNELIVVGGLVRRDTVWGGWITHIYVDNLDSVVGGQEIWGLPKQMAEFDWKGDREAGSVSVRQGDRLLCSLDYRWCVPFWRQSAALPCLSLQEHQFLQFEGRFTARFALRGAQLTVPPESPFASLEINQPLLVFSAEDLELVAGTPKMMD